MIEKRSQHILKKEIFIFVKNIVLTKNWFVVSIFFFYKFDKYTLYKLTYYINTLQKKID